MAPLCLLLVAILSAVSASAENATITPMERPLFMWQRDSAMTLEITATDGDALPLQYTVIPLTASLGLNQSELDRGKVWISGNIISADHNNYVSVTGPDTVLYVSCDAGDNSTMVVNDVMADPDKHPKAILLYTVDGKWCGLEGSDLPYQTIFSMTEATEAQQTLNLTHSGEGTSIATISGNVSITMDDGEKSQNGNNSAVAMSILYSITGLITLLFLVIIATGALRAHRYPERYGPRSSYGGRPRQSRAKGLARAVLETLPIVKFGDPTPPKPDPALELEHQPSRSSHDPAIGTRLSAIPEEPQSQHNRQSEVALATVPETALPTMTPGVGADSAAVGDAVDSTKVPGPDYEHLGCSICTEDFTVGEDVRVLPCDHKFHPACIDPWLVNVSGTCPLCRLDLRPQSERDKDGVVGSDGQQLPPPLAADHWNEGGATTSNNQTRHHQPQWRRSLRLLDLHRLRTASVEERIEILRRHRSQQQGSSTSDGNADPPEGQQPAADSDEQRTRRARLTDRLKDKFRIRTTRNDYTPRPAAMETAASS